MTGSDHSGFYPRDNLQRDGDGYKSYTIPLGLGTWHMVLVSKRRGFMPCISEEAVWQEISSSAYTTPLLKAWSKAIYERMLELPMLLRHCRAWGCECGLLNLTDERLDSLVTDLLREGKIDIDGHRCSNLNTLERPKCEGCDGSGTRMNYRTGEDQECGHCNGTGHMDA